MIHLQAVADYLRTGHAIRALRTLLARRKPIIRFDTELENRPRRYAAVIADYKANLPIVDIVAKHGCSTSTVHRYARMAGLYRERETSDHDTIVAMLQLGKPYTEIAAKGFSQGLISKVAKANNLHRYKR